MEATTSTTVKSHGNVKENSGVVKRPDRAELQQQCDAIMAEINALNEKAKEAKAASEKIMNDRSGSKGEIDAARNALKVLLAERTQLNNERNEINQLKEASRDKLTELTNSEKAKRLDLKFASLEAIDNQIKELEQRQARTSMSLTDEKKLVKEIHSLQMSKKNVAIVAEIKTNIEREKIIRQEYERRITEKNVELKLSNDKITAQKLIVDNLSKDTNDRDVIPNLRKIQTECREAAQDKFQKIRDLKSEFKKQEEAYAVFQAELAAKRKEARQKELEAKAIEEEKKRKEIEAAELARIPYEDEMNLCEHLIKYLKTFQDDKDNSKETATNSLSNANPSAFEGMKLLSRDDEDFLVIGSKKGKGKKKVGLNSLKKDTIVHSMDTLESFSLLQIAAPNSISQVSATIELLVQKKASYQGIERGSVPTMAELAKSRRTVTQNGVAPTGSSKSSNFSLENDFPALAVGGATKSETDA